MGYGMKIEGSLYKDSSFWLAEMPILDILTQGKTKKEALEMAQGAILDLVDSSQLEISLVSNQGDKFVLGSNSTDLLASLILRRQREKNGLSIADVADRLGFSSRNSYARYETSKTKISFSKFNTLYSAVSGSELTIR